MKKDWAHFCIPGTTWLSNSAFCPQKDYWRKLPFSFVLPFWKCVQLTMHAKAKKLLRTLEFITAKTKTNQLCCCAVIVYCNTIKG